MGNNEFLYADETIYSISPDWALEASTVMLEEWLWYNKGISAEKLTSGDVPGLVPEDVAPLLATNDLVDAYRQCPVSEIHAGATIIAIWVEAGNCWQCCEMYGLVSGFSASVVPSTKDQPSP